MGEFEGYAQFHYNLAHFTPRAQHLLVLAREEADRFNHNHVGTRHILLGLIKLGQGTAVSALGNRGIDLETVRIEVEKQLGAGSDNTISGEPPYTTRVKKVLTLAGKEAENLDHSYVGTEHILLGLLREGEGVAAKVLTSLNVDINQTQHDILAEIDPNITREEELQWLHTEADQGHAADQVLLGFRYLHGQEGVAEDRAKAAQWFRKAADQEDATAQSMLGFMYWRGLGVIEDKAEAVQWYRKAADNGDTEARKLLDSLLPKTD